MPDEQFEPYSRPNPRGESSKSYFITKVIIINIVVLIAVAYVCYDFSGNIFDRDYLILTGMMLFMISVGFVIGGAIDPMSAFGRGGGGYTPSMSPKQANWVAKMMTENMKNGLRLSMYSFPATIITIMVALLL